MFYWSFLIGSIAYTVAGLVFNELVKAYMRQMSQKAAEIDERFVNRLFITFHLKSEKTNTLMSYLLFLIWPITDVWVILKAENELNYIKQHVYKRETP